MLTIIELQARADGGHGLQSQSGREACWLEGWIAVPEALAETVWECRGHCDLEVREGVLVGVTPRERPAPPEEPDVPQSDVDAMAAAYRQGVEEA